MECTLKRRESTSCRYLITNKRKELPTPTSIQIAQTSRKIKISFMSFQSHLARFEGCFAHELPIEEVLGIFPSPRTHITTHTSLISVLRPRPLCKEGARNFFKLHGLYMEEELGIFVSSNPIQVRASKASLYLLHIFSYLSHISSYL